MPEDSTLRVSNLTKTYAGPAGTKVGGVREASFELPAGTFFTLLGPSGCGKTTTLRCIAGLEQPDSGVIQVGDRTFFDSARGLHVPMNERRLGMVFQSYAIWPHMTVFENVAFPLRVARDRRYSRAEIRDMVMRALATVSLDGLDARPATRLSGGQQQRVALARAIVRQPRLLLLDEPLSNLDAALREEMRNELKRLQQQIGVTTVYVTHDQTEALEMSDSIAIIEAGRIVQMGSPRDIYFQPRNGFVAGFVGATNLLGGAVAGEVDAWGSIAVTLDCGGGRILCVPAQAGRLDGHVRVSVRPETISLRQPGSPSGERMNRLNGEIVFAGFLGNSNRYRVKVGEAVLQANTAADARYAIGAPVAVDFPQESALALSN
ncbi:MAG: ABC transporter ATP-binding protein [Hyphomicrobiales bacterium]|nr:ABC transporter ATP-binding protein [Hyphomicrobiales bacterium]